MSECGEPHTFPADKFTGLRKVSGTCQKPAGSHRTHEFIKGRTAFVWCDDKQATERTT